MISLYKFIVIIVGCVLIAFGIDFFLLPNKVLDGGFIGIALIVNYLFEIKVGLILVLCSLPVFVYTWHYARSIFLPSLFGMITLSYSIDFLDSYHPFLPNVLTHPFIAAVVGGLLIGLGFGILLRYDITTGGMDLLAKLFASRLHLNVGILILLMDALVIILGSIFFNVDTMYLSIATITTGGLTTSLCTIKFYTY